MDEPAPSDVIRSLGGSAAGRIIIEKLRSEETGLSVEGALPLPNLARLSREDQAFIALFVTSGGSLQDVGKTLGISYPTVRNRLDRVIAELKALRAGEESRRLDVLTHLEKGEISAQEAARLLRGTGGGAPGKQTYIRQGRDNGIRGRHHIGGGCADRALHRIHHQPSGVYPPAPRRQALARGRAYRRHAARRQGHRDRGEY